MTQERIRLSKRISTPYIDVELANQLGLAFIWEDSVEGYMFWLTCSLYLRGDDPEIVSQYRDYVRIGEFINKMHDLMDHYKMQDLKEAYNA